MPNQPNGPFILSRAYGSNDIRGIVGHEIQQEDALRLGHAFGRYLEIRKMGKRVVVGGDVRISTPLLKTTLIKGLVQSGCQVLDLGIIPTPALYYAKEILRAPGAIMVTASHNPPDHNGFKPEVGDLPIVGDDLSELWQLVLDDAHGNGQGNLETVDFLPVYITQIKSYFSPSEQLRVVVDCGNGSMSPVAPALFRELGFDVIDLFAEIDGRFPNRPPDSAIASNLSALAQMVVKKQARLGIAFDGDGDRMGLVDEKGRIIDMDRVFLLFIHAVLHQKKGIVVYDLKCSNAIPEAIQSLGGTPMMEKTGHGFIKYSFLKQKAVLAGELTGHFSFDEIKRDDGLYAALRLAKIVENLDQPLSEYLDGFPHYFNTPDIRLKATSVEIDEVLSAIKHYYAQREKITELDGVRVDFSNGWGLTRASINAPEMTLRFEGRTSFDLKQIIHQFMGIHPLIDPPLRKSLDNIS